MSIQVGSTTGDYQVVAVLGVGGMGEVYRVRNTISDRTEAMKVLLPDLVNQPDLADRFLREIKVQASLHHPNIASMHTAVRVDNQLLLLMEFVEGVSLEQKLKDGPLPAAEAVDYIMQALCALEYAHGQGVVHRDIKPANMMVTPQGSVKLMDFGIAKGPADQKLTMTGATVGSLYYMSPEQIQGATTLDARSDLYSLGVSLYQLVTGKRPFDGNSQFAIMSAHLAGAPPPPISIDPKVPKLLNDVILMAVQKDVGTRFQTAKAMRNALNAVAAQLGAAAPAAPVAVAATPVVPITAKPAPPVVYPVPQAQPQSHRGQWMALGAVVAVLAIVAVIAVAPWKRPSASSIPTPAQPVASAPAAPIATPAPADSVPPPAAASIPSAPPPATDPQPAIAGRPKPARTPAPASSQNAAVHQPNLQPAAASTSQLTAQPISQPTAQPMQTQPPAPQPAVAAQPPAPTGPSRAELQAAREQLSLLGVRSASIRTSLQSLQRSQAASGLNLRGDMQEASNLMNTYLDGANAALRDGDTAQAASFMQKAERQIEKLEKFLGH
jgi:eukaryotic-like serine/threonine-protein kinase